ncbi:MAG: hypothetical protein PHE17_18115 [Thiothrix sp.]|uniref:hypothetical protein n=1 Tax=Thiothrix sp. TaxID=1032 RepID=UPI002635C5B3|nr:hypothetical protein [Thiothrix sp.]MDD5394937.1 hypothetical protein [Thiothrix sp.]
MGGKIPYYCLIIVGLVFAGSKTDTVTITGGNYAKRYYGDTSRITRLIGTLTGTADSSGKCHLADTLRKNNLDSIRIKKLLVGGATGSVIDTIKMIDGANDTLSITIGAKTWKFLPIADQ